MIDMTGDDGVSYFNSEHYHNPVEHDVVRNVMREERNARIEADERNNRIIKVVKAMIDIAGFDLVGRIKIRDRKTGKEYE